MDFFELSTPYHCGRARFGFANAPRTAVTFQGNGSNIIYIDWDNDLVVVVRWIRQSAFNEFIGHVVNAISTADRRPAFAKAPAGKPRTADRE